MGTEILQYFGLFVVSLAVLLKASDWFIDSAEEIGLAFGIPPFIIGLTIVAFGTSLPELATSIAAVFSGESEIVVGNVVGSNITNIALVLGIIGIIANPTKLEYNIWHIDMPYLWGSAFLLYFVLLDGKFTLFEGLLFIVGIILFLVYSFKSDDDTANDRSKIKAMTFVMLLVGGVLVWLGATYTIVAISRLSQLAGIDPEVIALSAVALGTSLPEVIVSISAAKKGQASMAVGNVLGSNIFNTFVVMAIPSFFGQLIIPENIMEFSLPLMIVMTLLFGIVSNNKKITRWEGALMLMFYAYYMVTLFENS